MEADINHIHIFKTNIGAVSTDSALHDKLGNHPEILQWSVDCDDCDCVLRVVSPYLKPDQISAIVQQCGYNCCELD